MSGSISFSVFCCQLGAMSWDEGGLARVLLQDLDNSGEKHNIYNNKKSWSIEIKANMAQNTVWAIEHTHEKFTCVSSLCLDLQHVILLCLRPTSLVVLRTLPSIFRVHAYVTDVILPLSAQCVSLVIICTHPTPSMLNTRSIIESIGSKRS